MADVLKYRETFFFYYTELARARQESFDVFKKNHADARTLEYLRKNLVAK